VHPYVLIALGSALGGVARYWCSSFIAARAGETFPWGTLVVNVVGSFAIGTVAALAEPEGRLYVSPQIRVFLMIGVFGGFTTFSSFSLQTLNLLREGEWVAAGGNVLVSVVACLVSVWAGYVSGLWLER
jgi:fluoride exporter